MSHHYSQTMNYKVAYFAMALCNYLLRCILQKSCTLTNLQINQGIL